MCCCCAQYIKDTIWKQFTTAGSCAISMSALCSIYQRYNLKAIHNLLLLILFARRVVLNISKIQSESNSQLSKANSGIPLVVLNISKIQSESNSQPSSVVVLFCFCCAQYIKDTIWKQFTTLAYSSIASIMLCSIYQRYNLKAIHNVEIVIN